MPIQEKAQAQGCFLPGDSVLDPHEEDRWRKHPRTFAEVGAI